MAMQQKNDWPDCHLLEVNLRVQSGAPVVRRTRMPAGAIIDNDDDGISVIKIPEQFEVPQDRIQAMLACAQSHRIPILLDKNGPVGAGRLLAGHEVGTAVELNWQP